MIGIDGVLHTYPEWFFLLLKGTNRQLVRSNAAPILERERKSEHIRILPLAIPVLRPLLEDVPDYRPSRAKASNPAFRSGRPRGSVRRGLLNLLECGIDQAVNRRYLDQCAEDLEYTRLSEERRRALVEEARMKRRQTRPVKGNLMNKDWREVYLREQRHPFSVLNGPPVRGLRLKETPEDRCRNVMGLRRPGARLLQAVSRAGNRPLTPRELLEPRCSEASLRISGLQTLTDAARCERHRRE